MFVNQMFAVCKLSSSWCEFVSVGSWQKFHELLHYYPYCPSIYSHARLKKGGRF